MWFYIGLYLCYLRAIIKYIVNKHKKDFKDTNNYGILSKIDIVHKGTEGNEIF